MTRVPSFIPALVLTALVVGAVGMMLRPGSGPAEPPGSEEIDAPPPEVAGDAVLPVVHGRVLDPDGRPCPEAVVIAMRDGADQPGPAETVRGRTGEGGVFEIDLSELFPERAAIELGAAKRACILVVLAGSGSVTASNPLDPFARPSIPITITLSPGAHVSGRLVTPEGIPLPDARVPLRCLALADPLPDSVRALTSGSSRTNSSGHFSATHLCPGTYALASVEGEWSLIDEVRFDIPPGAVGNFLDLGDIAVLATARVSIQLLSEATDEPMLRWSLRTQRVDDTGAFVDAIRNYAHPADRGWIHLEDLKPGSYRLLCEADGHRPCEEWIEVAPGAQLTYRWSIGPDISLIGRSTDPFGQPIVGAPVLIGRAGCRPEDRTLQTTTDEDGYFAISRTNLGTIDLFIDTRNHIPVLERNLEIVADEILDLGTLVHSPGTEVFGRILYTDGRAPKWAYVGIFGETDEGERLERRTAYDEGRFTFPGIPPGTYQVTLGYPDAQNRSARHETEPFVITNQPRHSVEVTIPDE